MMSGKDFVYQEIELKLREELAECCGLIAARQGALVDTYVSARVPGGTFIRPKRSIQIYGSGVSNFSRVTYTDRDYLHAYNSGETGDDLLYRAIYQTHPLVFYILHAQLPVGASTFLEKEGEDFVDKLSFHLPRIKTLLNSRIDNREYFSFPGEGRIMAAVGSGVLVAATSIHEAYIMMNALHAACRMQVVINNAGVELSSITRHLAGALRSMMSRKGIERLVSRSSTGWRVRAFQSLV